MEDISKLYCDTISTVADKEKLPKSKIKDKLVSLTERITMILSILEIVKPMKKQSGI